MNLTLDEGILDVESEEDRDQDAGQAPHGLPWRSSIQFIEEAYEPIQWLIPDVLPTGAIVLLSGRAGTMKSFLALSMAHAIASGTPWLGRPTKQAPVLYLDGENPPAVLQDRLQGIGTAEGLNIWSSHDKTFPQSLKHPDLQRARTTHSLIVVDTLRRQMGKLKEDSADDMAQITDDLKELRRDGATVLVLHHAPKNPTKTGPRGSSELEAGCDVSISLTKSKKRRAVLLTLEMSKNRFAPDADDLEIEAMRGEKAPLFRILGDQGGEQAVKNDLHKLAMLIDALRGSIGRDPMTREVLEAANDKGLGGRSIVERMLEEGVGRYWSKEKSGRETRYAPPTGQNRAELGSVADHAAAFSL